MVILILLAVILLLVVMVGYMAMKQPTQVEKIVFVDTTTGAEVAADGHEHVWTTIKADGRHCSICDVARA